LIHFKRFNSKRVFDLTLCLISLPIVLPLSLFVTVALFLDFSGSVLFRQERIGRNGKPFKVYKFRTLVEGAEPKEVVEFMQSYIRGEVDSKHSESSVGFKPDLSSRVTLVGKFLRKTSLDELPQLINVLKGEMSLVGSQSISVKQCLKNIPPREFFMLKDRSMWEDQSLVCLTWYAD
jgi:lipopolysaccharide/colanic/teichoic acid biosynthesis glycosyltransferase